MRKIIPYLLLNFAVSAAAILIVLIIWDRTHDVPGIVLFGTPAIATPVVQNNQPPAIIPLDQQTFEIQMVVGAGDINLERVQLVSVADANINIQGWTLADGNRNVFTFPSLTVFPGGGLSVFTRSGLNTSVELFWGNSEAVWTSGETVKLLDPDGHLRASYKIP
jgi:hypothetical protein